MLISGQWSRRAKMDWSGTGAKDLPSFHNHRCYPGRWTLQRCRLSKPWSRRQTIGRRCRTSSSCTPPHSLPPDWRTSRCPSCLNFPDVRGGCSCPSCSGLPHCCSCPDCRKRWHICKCHKCWNHPHLRSCPQHCWRCPHLAYQRLRVSNVNDCNILAYHRDHQIHNCNFQTTLWCHLNFELSSCSYPE